MPPRVKTPVASPAAKRAARATRGTPKAAAVAAAAEQPKNKASKKVQEAKAEEVPRETKEEVKANEDAAEHNSHVGVGDLNAEPEEETRLETHGSASLKKEEEEVKETADEYERDERLDLEDNEPEYEVEEYGGMDYDEKEADQEDAQEEAEEVMEDVEEGDVGEEEEGDMGEDDSEDVQEELEGEEDEHDDEEQKQPELVDAEEEKEHHELFKERRKRKEFEIFVGGLDKDATEEDLKNVFNAVGEVTEVRLMMNPQTKKNKGFAFLRFATVEQARRAVTDLKNPVVNGKRCGVTPSEDSDTLFLGNICKTWTKEALEKKLKHYGIDNIEDLTLVEDSNNQGLNRGFAFLEFSSRSDAMDAFKRLQKRDVVFGVDRPAKVSFADSFIDPGDEIMSQVKTVFVDGIPASWDEDRIRDLLNKYGEVEKIELARNMPSARRKDFGFVTFDTHDSAVNCAKSINNADLGEGENKTKIRARLSRPLQRGKGRHNARGDYRGGRPGRTPRAPWNRLMPRALPPRVPRGVGGRIRPAADYSLKRPAGIRGRRAAMAAPVRARPLLPPPRSYDRRAPAAYPKSSLKRDYPRREDHPPRSRAASDYGSRSTERRLLYRDGHSSRAPGYGDLPTSAPSGAAPRRAYAEETYGSRYDRPPPSYREGRARDYDSVSGSKRPYSAIDDIPPRYSDTGARHSRARLDYNIPGGATQYGDAYSDRHGRGTSGYSGGRTSTSSQDSHGYYSSRHGMGYGGSYSGSGVGGGMYSSNFAGDYISRGSDVSSSSYPSSLYSSRSLGGSGYMGSGGSGSYY